MPVWKFLPQLKTDDPRWGACEYRRPLLVSAENLPLAQRKAENWYVKFFGQQERENTRISKTRKKIFENEKLYHPEILPLETLTHEQQKYPTVF